MKSAHVRFINNWKPLDGIKVFFLFNVWWGWGFVGIGVLNFAVEWGNAWER